MKVKSVKLYSFFFILLSMSLLFQDLLIKWVSFFAYLDEVLAIIMMLWFVMYSFLKKNTRRKERIVVYLMLIIILFTLLYNFIFKIQNNYVAIVEDILSIFKFVFVYFGLLAIKRESSIDTQESLNILNYLLKPYILIVLFLGLVNLFIPIGMDDGIRYGIRMYCFVFDIPGNLINQITYIIILFLANESKTKTSHSVWLIICCFILIMTLKTRAMILAAIFISLYIFAKRKRKVNSVAVAIVIVFLSFLIGFSQFEFYFMNPNAPRQRFVMVSMDLVRRYFPFGTGFGTFGSAGAAKYYSPIYYEYGFDQLWGMTSDNPMYLNDNYFPMIFAQMGFFVGLLFIILLIVYFYNLYISSKNKSKLIQYGVLFYIIDLLFSSIQSSYLAHYSVVAITFLTMLYLYDYDEVENDYRYNRITGLW